jgi:hypothetical protein
MKKLFVGVRKKNCGRFYYCQNASTFVEKIIKDCKGKIVFMLFILKQQREMFF